MNVRTVEIPGSAEFPELGRVAFIVGDTLTIYEAAMVYSDRHPGGQILNGTKDYDRAEISDYELYLGKGARAEPGKRTWDIYCHLWKMIDTGEIKVTRPAYTPGRRLDPRDTRIATGDIVKLARACGEMPFYLSLWKSRQAPDPSRPRARIRRKSDVAMRRIEEAFPDGGVPPLAEMSDGKLYQLVTKSDGATPAFSPDTCKRARRSLALKLSE
jgi:hypothetical protein